MLLACTASTDAMQAIFTEPAISPITTMVFRCLPFVVANGLKWHFLERIDLYRSGAYCGAKLVDE